MDFGSRIRNYLLGGGLILATCLLACQPKDQTQDTKVEIKQVDGQYDFYINGERFDLKGAGLDMNAGQDFQSLAAAGANAFRTWTTKAAPMELDSAVKYGRR